MANKKAAKKDILTNKRNNLRNTHFKSLMKTRIKNAESAIESNDKETVTIIVIEVVYANISNLAGLWIQ